MIESIKTLGIAPILIASLEFGSRTNIISGDNGLGKSFILELVWWSITQIWTQEINDTLKSGF